MLGGRGALAAWGAAMLLGACDGGDSGDGDGGDGGLSLTDAGSCETGCEGPPFEASAPDVTQGWVMSVWGPDAGTLFAAGGVTDRADRSGRGFLLRKEGQTWTPMPVPADTPMLNWVFGFSAEDLWVVGELGHILRWDGAAFEVQSSGTDQALWGVWGTSPTDLWAVGGGGLTVDSVRPTVLRYDGTAWTPVPVPQLSPSTARQLFKVWGRSQDEVYIVGQSGVLLGWDGVELTQRPVMGGFSDDWITVWGNPQELVLVGGRGSMQIAVQDENGWRAIEDRFAGGVNGVWSAGPGFAYASGESGTVWGLDLEAAEIAWERRITPDPREDILHAIFGLPDGTLVTVGGNLLGRGVGDEVGFIYEAAEVSL